MEMSCIGWLSATGELVKCDGHAHVTVATDIARKMYGYTNSRPDEILLQHGWTRISRMTYGDLGLIFFLPRIISEYQLDFLRRVFDDNAKMISQKGLDILYNNHIISYSEMTALK